MKGPSIWRPNTPLVNPYFSIHLPTTVRDFYMSSKLDDIIVGKNPVVPCMKQTSLILIKVASLMSSLNWYPPPPFIWRSINPLVKTASSPQSSISAAGDYDACVSSSEGPPLLVYSSCVSIYVTIPLSVTMSVFSLSDCPSNTYLAVSTLLCFCVY